MSTFVLVRHAKSDRPPGIDDIDRDLSDRGGADAGLLGAFLGAALPPPRILVSSPALRARRTAELVAGAAGWDARVAVDDRLYGGGVGDLLAVLAARGDGVVAFGHEPVWSAAVSLMIGGGSITMVTAAAACVEGDPEPGGGSLRWLITPALLGGGPS